MKNLFIPIKVKCEEKKEIWQLDVTGLTVLELIKLREELKKSPFTPTITSLDNLIYNNINKFRGGNKLQQGAYSKEQNRNIVKTRKRKVRMK